MKKLLLSSAVLALTACGGSGMNYSSSSMSMSASTSTMATSLQSASAPQEPFNIPATQLSAMVNGNTYTLVYSETANTGTTSFDGQQANSSTISVAISENGGTPVMETTTAYYLLSPYTPLGISGTAAGGIAYQIMFNNPTGLPAMLTPGESGQLVSGNFSAGTITGTFTQNYMVTANNASTVTLTLSGNVMLMGGSTMNDSAVSQTTFTVDATGNIKLVSAEVTINGMMYTFM